MYLEVTKIFLISVINFYYVINKYFVEFCYGVSLFWLSKLIYVFLRAKCIYAEADCSLSDIVVSQKNTGKIVEEPEYSVTIENKCSCPQADIKVFCYGISSVEVVDPSKIRPIDRELCLIANGEPVTKGSPVTFTYAIQTPQSFYVVHAMPRC
jgi:hypothetical protein